MLLTSLLCNLPQLSFQTSSIPGMHGKLLQVGKINKLYGLHFIYLSAELFYKVAQGLSSFFEIKIEMVTHISNEDRIVMKYSVCFNLLEVILEIYQ